MKIVGLTGGIGSGKTTVAKLFQDLGVAVYIADNEAKKLMVVSKIIRRHLTQLLGKEAYSGDQINRSFIAEKIFNNPDLLAGVNGIVHPKVAAHFKRWVKKQNGSYCIKEAAILFETGGYKDCDVTILVTAPMEVRIARVLKRDQTTKAAVANRMKNQWSDEKKIALADIIIENIDLQSTEKRVAEIHRSLL